MSVKGTKKGIVTVIEGFAEGGRGVIHVNALLANETRINGFKVTDAEQFRKTFTEWKESCKYTSRARNIIQMHFKIVTNTTWFANDTVFTTKSQCQALTDQDRETLKVPGAWSTGKCGGTDFSATTVSEFVRHLAEQGVVLKPFNLDGAEGFEVADGEAFRGKMDAWKEERGYKSKPRNILHAHFRSAARGQWFDNGAILVPNTASARDKGGEGRGGDAGEQWASVLAQGCPLHPPLPNPGWIPYPLLLGGNTPFVPHEGAQYDTSGRSDGMPEFATPHPLWGGRGGFAEARAGG
eukprot:CAMPEP_0174917538 /NCGR_PEP_ID=MMETSP1355-20121228/2527_1 /TAXON_ID=464990 /ORGANISM="Hemiselmis tepida, Strain CCMP443" /LENGTH=294 /DNA_ID=CAMNT_0016162645 /DNA_START=70 /DNA_END=951 /DNA_ORIENTATION=+